MRLAADLNNMSWRVRPEEVLLEVGKNCGSKVALQKLSDVSYANSAICTLFPKPVHRFCSKTMD